MREEGGSIEKFKENKKRVLWKTSQQCIKSKRTFGTDGFRYKQRGVRGERYNKNVG